jgi:leucyl-tRNA---protein transferase
MKLISPPKISPEEPCPYADGELTRHEFFLAQDLTEEELDSCLERGFRKFGIYYFRPACHNCTQCIPLRVSTEDFTPSTSQKRVLKKNKDIVIKYGPLAFREEIYQLYIKHSQVRFNYTQEKIGPREEFIQTHFTPSAPSLLSEFWLDGNLVGVGFLDISKKSVSSVYFIYDPDLSKRSLGIFGVLKEIEFALETGRPFYYLGYYIESNKSMRYKEQFRPHQKFNWNKEIWEKD